jgi:hypothetical protein
MTGKCSLIEIAMLGLILSLPPYAVRAQDAVDKPLAPISTDTPGVHIDILSIKRSEGRMLTLHAAFVNESGAPVKDSVFPGMNGSGWRVSLLDPCRN